MLKWCSRSIFLQVVIGLVIGILCGVGFPEFSAQLKPLGDGFIKLIKMLIALIVFCVVVSGISGAGDLKKVGRIGFKSVVYFEVLTTLALLIGLLVAYGSGLGRAPTSTSASCRRVMRRPTPRAPVTCMGRWRS